MSFDKHKIRSFIELYLNSFDHTSIKPMMISTIDQYYFNILTFDFNMKEHWTRIHQFIFLKLEIASWKLKLFCSIISFINNIFLFKELFNNLQYFQEFDLFWKIFLFNITTNKSIEDGVKKLSIIVNEQFIYLTFYCNLSCILWVSFLFSFYQDHNIGAFIFIWILKIIESIR